MSMNPRLAMRRLARVGEILAIAGGIGVLAFAIAAWMDGPRLARNLTANLPGVEMPTGNGLFVAYLLSLVPAICFALAMAHAVWVFSLLRRGELFSPTLPRALSHLGLWAGISALAGMLMRTALALVVTLQGPPGTRMLVIGIDSSEIAALVMAVLLFVFAALMREAMVLAEDNRGFV